jgi:amidase
MGLDTGHLSTMTASEAVKRLAANDIGSVELLDALLARVDRHNGAVNAVVAFDLDRAREQAVAADEARARGELLGPLHGLPMTIKDSFETEGLVTTSGAPALADHVPDTDADAVAELKAAGAIVYGKTNLPLFAGDFQSYNDVYGLTRNPWDPDRTPGGSSGGAAAALAAGMTLLELGSDIGGSIRNPAHYCGVFGHKPTWSAVSDRGHVPGPPGSLASPDLNVAGPLGRSVADLELGLGVLVGEGVAGVPGVRFPDPAHAVRSIPGCRVGVWLDDPAAPVARDVRAVLDAMVDRLADDGAVVVTDARPETPLAESHQVYLQLLMAVLGSGFPAEVQDLMAGLAADADPDDRSFAVVTARAVVQSHREWQAANEKRARIAAEYARLFEQVDVLLTPVTPVAAFPHDTETSFADRVLDVDGEAVPYPLHLVWAGLATLPLLPATVVPAGLTPDGLPVGVQIVGPRWGDRTTLAFAHLVEERVGGFQPPPGF